MLTIQEAQRRMNESITESFQQAEWSREASADLNRSIVKLREQTHKKLIETEAQLFQSDGRSREAAIAAAEGYAKKMGWGPQNVW
jgi:hypothetical protein